MNEVTVHADVYRAWAQCTCGWEGAQRHFKQTAQADAAQHMTDTGHPTRY